MKNIHLKEVFQYPYLNDKESECPCKLQRMWFASGSIFLMKVLRC